MSGCRVVSGPSTLLLPAAQLIQASTENVETVVKLSLARISIIKLSSHLFKCHPLLNGSLILVSYKPRLRFNVYINTIIIRHLRKKLANH